MVILRVEQGEKSSDNGWDPPIVHTYMEGANNNIFQLLLSCILGGSLGALSPAEI